jgi:hypothetical protein
MYRRSSKQAGIWWGLGPDVRNALANQADQEIAERSVFGALVYFLVSLSITVSTPYYPDHPFIIIAIGSTTLLLGGVRTLSAFYLKAHFAAGCFFNQEVAVCDHLRHICRLAPSLPLVTRCLIIVIRPPVVSASTLGDCVRPQAPDDSA